MARTAHAAASSSSVVTPRRSALSSARAVGPMPTVGASSASVAGTVKVAMPSTLVT